MAVTSPYSVDSPERLDTTNERPQPDVMVLCFPIAMLHCQVKFSKASLSRSGEEILHDAVGAGDVAMMAFMHEKQITFDGDQLILIAIMKMSPSVITYLCSEMRILPNKFAILRCWQRASYFVENFDRGGLHPCIARRVHRALNLIMMYSIHTSTVSKFYADPGCKYVLRRLLQIAD